MLSRICRPGARGHPHVRSSLATAAPAANDGLRVRGAPARIVERILHGERRR
jgi:hypothetical protein